MVATSVTPQVIADALARPLPPYARVAQWQGWIYEALFLIGRAFPGVALDQETVDYVVKQAVVEHVRAWRETAEDRTEVAIDDGRVSRSYVRDAGPLSIADWLMAMLDPDGDSGGQAFSIRPAYSPDLVRLP